MHAGGQRFESVILHIEIEYIDRLEARVKTNPTEKAEHTMKVCKARLSKINNRQDSRREKSLELVEEKRKGEKGT